eukprot:scaffold518_cov388-Prasinococcus_capsulatus_cf.AAC.39
MDVYAQKPGQVGPWHYPLERSKGEQQTGEARRHDVSGQKCGAGRGGLYGWNGTRTYLSSSV